MSESNNKTPSPLRANNMLIMGVVGQVGIVTLAIVLGAVLIGLVLDNQFDTKPFITIGLVVLSVPLNIMSMFRIVTRATAKIKDTQMKEETSKTED